jgi:hypothetical protein
LLRTRFRVYARSSPPLFFVVQRFEDRTVARRTLGCAGRDERTKRAFDCAQVADLLFDVFDLHLRGSPNF